MGGGGRLLGDVAEDVVVDDFGASGIGPDVEPVEGSAIPEQASLWAKESGTALPSSRADTRGGGGGRAMLSRRMRRKQVSGWRRRTWREMVVRLVRILYYCSILYECMHAGV